MILIGGTHKKTEAAAKLSSLLLENAPFSTVNFLYAFNASKNHSSPIINVKDLLLRNAEKDYQKLLEKLSEKVQEKDFTSEFQIDISSDKIVNYVNMHDKRLIVLGESENTDAGLKTALREIHLFLKKTSCSVLIVPEKTEISYPENAHAISDLGALNVMTILREQLSLKPNQLRIISISEHLSTAPVDDKGTLCQKVKERYFRFFKESYKEKNSDIVILIAESVGQIPTLEMRCLYELCTSVYHVPFLIINPKSYKHLPGE